MTEKGLCSADCIGSKLKKVVIYRPMNRISMLKKLEPCARAAGFEVRPLKSMPVPFARGRAAVVLPFAPST